jgi:hypothetical protein
MINRTKTQAKEDMKNYKRDQFWLYVDEAGWESWMEEYTDSKDGKSCTDEQIITIESIQQELWDEVHN